MDFSLIVLMNVEQSWLAKLHSSLYSSCDILFSSSMWSRWRFNPQHLSRGVLSLIHIKISISTATYSYRLVKLGQKKTLIRNKRPLFLFIVIFFYVNLWEERFIQSGRLVERGKFTCLNFPWYLCVGSSEFGACNLTFQLRALNKRTYHFQSQQ